MKNAKIKKHTIKNIYYNIVVFLILYITSGYTTRIMSGAMQIAILTIIVGTLLLIQKGFAIHKRLFIVLSIMCTVVIISSIGNSDSFKNMFIMISVILISGLIVNQMKFEDFSKAYLKVIYLTAKFSLAVYILSIILPDVIRLFPPTYARIGRETYNLFLSVSNLRMSPMRNMGFFWEPGAYQTFIILAMIIHIFYFKSKNKKQLGILALSLLSTLSTTGIVAGVLVLILYYLSKKEYLTSRVIKVTLIIIVIAVVFIASFPYLPKSIQHATVGKFKGVFTDSIDVNISASIRFGSVYHPLIAVSEKPIFGLSFGGLYDLMTIKTGYALATNTPVNWIATYGIIFATICYYGIFRFSKILSSSWLIRLLIVLTIILTLSSEQYLRNVAILIFVFYGIAENLINKKKLKKVFEYKI